MKYRTPYYTYNLKTLTKNVKLFKSALPFCKTYYAVKANIDERIIKEIDSFIDGYDAASIGEIETLINLGINPERIFFNNPVKISYHIEEAYKAGVRIFSFDSETEIDKLAKYAPKSKLFLRFKVSDKGSMFPLSKKFGIDEDLALKYAKKAESRGLSVIGITFHVGSQAETLKVWESAIIKTSTLVKKLSKIGINISIVDVGGGFPAIYEDMVPEIHSIGRTIKAAIDKYMPDGIQYCAEPGRFIVANIGNIHCTVIGKEKRGDSDWLYLDVGTFQGLMESIEMPELKYPIKCAKIGRKKRYILTGPTCDAYDTIGKDYLLPSNITVGDRLVIESAGAYTKVYETKFNGFAPLPVQYIGSK